jgi:cysteine desulfurase
MAFIYLDNAATTKPCPEAAAAAENAILKCWGNPSASYSAGREARILLEEARASVAQALGARPEEVIFTSGGTESDNYALLGAANRQKNLGRHIISGQTEHEAVLETLRQLGTAGFEITLLPPDEKGSISLSSVESALREDTILVSLMLVNNETGAVNPVGEVSKLLKARASKALLHTDAVQAFKKLPFTVKSLGADIVTVSSHKIHGVKGAGAVWVKKGIRLNPLIYGGGQEGGSRSGTEAVPAIAAFGSAARRKSSDNFKRLNDMLRAQLPEAVFIGRDTVPHIQCLSLRGCKAEVLANYLDSVGICVSPGLGLCEGQRSHVLRAMGLPADLIDGALRVSFSEIHDRGRSLTFSAELKKAAARYFGKR